jgi:cell division protein FtsI/penicillin-binding protein 2
MHVAVQRGTAKELHAEDAIAKTGTAQCQQHCVANNDGFVVVLTPAVNPRLLLLVRKKGTTGALTAATAQLILNDLKETHGDR